MPKLSWDTPGTRIYETGVDHGVLYVGTNKGVAWNGLVSVTESPSGAEASPQYADNIKYLNLVSAEELGGTIEAFTYPEEFAACDGTLSPTTGITIGQQSRRIFGLSYRTRLGNDLLGSDYGYKLHLVYNALAAPTEKAYGTINDSPEAITFSWEFSTTPVEVGESYKPTAHLTIDSTKVDSEALSKIIDILYGTSSTYSRLPNPAYVISLLGGFSTQPDTPVEIVTAKSLHYNLITELFSFDDGGFKDLEPTDEAGFYSIPSSSRLKVTSTAGVYQLVG